MLLVHAVAHFLYLKSILKSFQIMVSYELSFSSVEMHSYLQVQEVKSVPEQKTTSVGEKTFTTTFSNITHQLHYRFDCFYICNN